MPNDKEGSCDGRIITEVLTLQQPNTRSGVYMTMNGTLVGLLLLQVNPDGRLISYSDGSLLRRSRVPTCELRLIGVRDDLQKKNLASLLWLLAQVDLLGARRSYVYSELPECFLKGSEFWKKKLDDFCMSGTSNAEDTQILYGFSKCVKSLRDTLVRSSLEAGTRSSVLGLMILWCRCGHVLGQLALLI